MSDDAVLGLSRHQQLLLIGAVGAVLVVAGESMSSAVSPDYDPLVYGVGVVMVLYAVVTAVWDGVRS